MTSEFNETGIKVYEIKQIGHDGIVLSSKQVEASSGEAAAKQLNQVVDGTDRISICLDGTSMNEMGVEYWQKRVRRR